MLFRSGSVRVLDALATQGFEHPTRSPFFFSERVEFFALCRDRGIDPREPKGSYAGAMGDAQLMPSNYRNLALDYAKDGQTDLWSLTDAIGRSEEHTSALQSLMRISYAV